MQAMDLFDMSNGYSSLEEGVQRVICPVLVIYHTCTHAHTHTHTHQRHCSDQNSKGQEAPVFGFILTPGILCMNLCTETQGL